MLTLKTALGGQKLAVKALVADGAVYVQDPTSTGSWIKQDIPRGLGGLISGDPSTALDALKGATDDVKLLGKEAVRGGDQADHYRGTIDPTQLADTLPQAERDQLRALGDSWPFDAWIDDQGRLRKLDAERRWRREWVRWALDRRAPAGTTGDAGGMSLTTTIELYDFGTPVTVRTPDPEAVRDVPSFGGAHSEPTAAPTA